MTYIYILKDPRSDIPRYVGQTRYPEQRLKGHLSDHSNDDKHAWFDELCNEGLHPVIEIIEECFEEDADDREMLWIRRLSKKYPLVNISYSDANEKKDKIVHTALERSTWKELALVAVEKEVRISSLIRQAIDDFLIKIRSENIGRQ